MKALYIHIPFCKRICTYCDFAKVLMDPFWVEDYLKKLEEEIKDKYALEEIKTLYIGGGTPSALSLDALYKLMAIIKNINLADDYEFSFECNIEDLTEDKLSILKEAGVNRLSIGIESFNPKLLKFMGRKITFDVAKNNIQLARKYNFNNINLDLMYSLPDESLGILRKDLDLILKLKPEHISAYSLIIEDNTVVGINNVMPNDEDTDYDMYNIIRKTLIKHGYEQYELSNYAKKGYVCQHNLTYWHNENYYGFGLGAHGYIGNVRYENTRSLTNYLNGKFILKENLLSKAEDMDNYLMLGFRLVDGISLSEFYERYNISLLEHYNINELIKSKEIIIDNDYIKINPKYLYVMNEILIKII